MSTVDPKNLGHRVSSRDLNWADLCHRAWGVEFYAPDHNTYQFSNGRSFDSTDKGKTGLYGVEVTEPLFFDDPNGADRYTDMDRSIQESTGSQNPIHSDV